MTMKVPGKQRSKLAGIGMPDWFTAGVKGAKGKTGKAAKRAYAKLGYTLAADLPWHLAATQENAKAELNKYWDYIDGTQPMLEWLHRWVPDLMRAIPKRQHEAFVSGFIEGIISDDVYLAVRFSPEEIAARSGMVKMAS